MRQKRGNVSQFDAGTGQPPREFVSVCHNRVHHLSLQLDSGENYVADLHQAVITDVRELVLKKSSKGEIKWYLSLSARFRNAMAKGSWKKFNTEHVVSTSANPLEFQLLIVLRQLWQDIDTYEQNGNYNNISN